MLLAHVGVARAADPNEFLNWSLMSGSTTLLPGRLYVPQNYDPSKSYPIIVFFHGSGEGGNNNTSQVGPNINNLFAAAKTREAFLYAPQSANGLWSGSGTNITTQMTRSIQMLDAALATYNIDPHRQYVTGLSAGGNGAWDAASKFPGRFAAAVPICGDWIRANPMASVLASMPVWTYHARNDSAIDVNQTRSNVNNILLYGYGYPKMAYPLDTPDGKDFYDGSPYYPTSGSLGATFLEYEQLRYTEYFSGGHAIWSRAYNEQFMYDWMFSQSTGAIPEPACLAIVTMGAFLVGLRPRRRGA